MWFFISIYLSVEDVSTTGSLKVKLWSFGSKGVRVFVSNLPYTTLLSVSIQEQLPCMTVSECFFDYGCDILLL
jgi:hypothetical protein